MLLRRKLEAGSEAYHYLPNTTRPCGTARRVQIGLRHFFDILCLKTFGTLCNREFYTIAFLQGLVSVAHYCRIVHKNIPARGPLNETETFFVVEPLDFALLFTHYPQTPFLHLQHPSEVKQSGIILKKASVSTFCG